ncbi:MAG: cysteine desulfurase [Hyphomicrobiaceae bacterium]
MQSARLEGIREAPAAAKRFDADLARAQFPILFREVHGKPLVYLDSAGSAQKPLAVIEAMDHALRHEYANVHRGIHYLSNAATQAYEDARETTRRFLNARGSEEIVFTKNATEAINLVAYSWAMANLAEGDEIILSILEHHSNIVPWHFLRERMGIVLKWAPIADDGAFLVDEYEALFSPRTKLVALTHMSNVTGTRIPARTVADIAHAHGVPILLDGCQSAVHEPLDMQAMDCDFFVFSGHKVYGPSGIGVLYAKREFLSAMRPFLGGGSMIESVAMDAISYGALPNRFEAGTPPIVEAIGLRAALDFMMQLGLEEIAAHERAITVYAHERLTEFNWLTSYGTTSDKSSIVAFSVDGLHPHDVAMIVDRSGVAIRAGHHCAQPLMERFAVPALCRASFGLYTTRADIDELARALVKAHDLFA